MWSSIKCLKSWAIFRVWKLSRVSKSSKPNSSHKGVYVVPKRPSSVNFIFKTVAIISFATIQSPGLVFVIIGAWFLVLAGRNSWLKISDVSLCCASFLSQSEKQKSPWRPVNLLLFIVNFFDLTGECTDTYLFLVSHQLVQTIFGSFCAYQI